VDESLPIYYPLHSFGPLMKGMVIGAMGIFHVYLAQFAIGGGLLMCWFQHLAMRRPAQEAAVYRKFLTSLFGTLVLLSFVLGALTGVGMWFTSIQIGPSTIGMMVHTFHWLWATEWTFFALEIVAGYAFYRTAARLTDRARMSLLVLYAFAAWMSLFIINGILSWQLTPGRWVETGNIWEGFFNASFWPTLLFRTIVAMVIGSLVSCIVINAMPGLDRPQRTLLINRAAWFMAPMVLMPLLGLWFLAVIPADSRSFVLGGSSVMTMFMNIAVAMTLLIGAYAIVGMIRQKLYINGATATLLAALAFGATAGGEFVREGVRKPFTIRETLFSNSITPQQVAHLRQIGSVKDDPYPLLDEASYPNDQLRLGAKVFRFQCSICHTTDGVNGLQDLTGTWTIQQKRMNIAMLQHTKPFMPPFSGTPADLEALVQLLTWRSAGQPRPWPISDVPEVLSQIEAYLNEAGVTPNTAEYRTVEPPRPRPRAGDPS
jgi:cytochrome d ubiquinol oxidase subunit I